MFTDSLNHIVLTVSNLERAHKFYNELLELKTEFYKEHNVFCITLSDMSIWVCTHEQVNPDDCFSEFRVGLDHLSFNAPDREALDALAMKLKEAGVETNGVEIFEPSGDFYIAFRDPDNIQLEYWLDNDEG